MSKIDLDPITSGYNLSKINNNFQKIEDALNEEVLYRKGYLGEPNEMQTNLDMNGKQILNVTTGTSDGSLVTKGYVDQGLALKFDKSGGTMSGPVDMSSNEILNVSRLSADRLELGGVQVVPTSLVIDPYNGTREALRRSYAEAGYSLVVGSFEVGGVLVNPNDVLLRESTGKAYSGPAGVVPPGTDPIGVAFTDRSGELLRLELLAGIAEIRDGEMALTAMVSITDFDGIDDFNGLTGTNNKDSFSRAINHLNNIGGGLLRLPRTLTGVYFINGDDHTQVTTTIRLDPEPGVSIRLIYSGGADNSPLVNTSLQTTRQLPIYFQNFGFTSFIGANVTRQLGEALPTLHNADGVYSLPESLAGSAFKIIDLANPATVLSPVSSAADAIVFAGAGTSRAAISHVSAGDEVLALMSSPTSGVFFAGVVTANGYAYVAQNSGDQAVKLVEDTTGLPPVVLGIPYAHTLDQQRDNFNNSLVSVRVTSSRSFSVLVNGLVVYSYTTRSSISSVAFGTENINDNISVSQMSRVRQGRTTGGAKALKILMVGDSITDDAVQYSHAKYLQMLLGSAGVSVAEINNIAVAGQTAAQQYAILQTVGSGYDIVCVQVGVNDVQGGTNFASFTSTIVNIVNYCNGIGAAPIVAVPTAFYSKAEAIANGQPGGQNTANNSALHTYRALLIRAVASAGGFLNMETMKGFGAMSAKWLSIAPYSVSDRIVVDNIHPSPYGSMMLAQGWARSILGWLNRPDSTKAEAFETIPGSWLISGFGLVDKPTIRSRELKGVLSLHATINNDGAVAFVLPPAYFQEAIKIIPVVALNSSYLPVGPCSMYVGTNGNVYFFNLPAGTTKVQLDGALV